MYNGVGLSTPKGSGTSGYVQSNLAASQQEHQRQQEPDLKPERKINTKFSEELLEHERRRAEISRNYK